MSSGSSTAEADPTQDPSPKPGEPPTNQSEGEPSESEEGSEGLVTGGKAIEAVVGREVNQPARSNGQSEPQRSTEEVLYQSLRQSAAAPKNEPVVPPEPMKPPGKDQESELASTLKTEAEARQQRAMPSTPTPPTGPPATDQTPADAVSAAESVLRKKRQENIERHRAQVSEGAKRAPESAQKAALEIQARARADIVRELNEKHYPDVAEAIAALEKVLPPGQFDIGAYLPPGKENVQGQLPIFEMVQGERIKISREQLFAALKEHVARKALSNDQYQQIVDWYEVLEQRVKEESAKRLSAITGKEYRAQLAPTPFTLPDASSPTHGVPPTPSTERGLAVPGTEPATSNLPAVPAPPPAPEATPVQPKQLEPERPDSPTLQQIKTIARELEAAMPAGTLKIGNPEITTTGVTLSFKSNGQEVTDFKALLNQTMYDQLNKDTLQQKYNQLEPLIRQWYAEQQAVKRGAPTTASTAPSTEKKPGFLDRIKGWFGFGKKQ